MKLTYGAEPISYPTPEIVEWIRKNIPARELIAGPSPYWQGPLLSFFNRLWGPYLPIDSPNTLFWPQGASRWAFMPVLFSENQLATLLLGQGGNFVFPLSIETSEETVTTDMWMLPPRPIAQISGSGKGLYLVTLVDERYWWWFKSASIKVTYNTTTWEDLYADIASALDITIDADAIDAAYLKPGDGFTNEFESLPLMLDAVAFSVGQRIVRKLDGSVLAMSPDSSFAALKSNFTNRTGTALKLYAGGRYLLLDKDNGSIDLDTKLSTASVFDLGNL